MALAKWTWFPMLLLFATLLTRLRNRNFGCCPNALCHTSATTGTLVPYDAPYCSGWAPLFCAHTRNLRFRIRCCPYRLSTSYLLLLLACGDVEPNPGPTKSVSADRSKDDDAMQKEFTGRPLTAVSAKSFHRGDHIIYRVTEEPYRACYESALVSCVRDGQILLLKNTQEGGVTQEWVSFSHLKEPHIIEYSEGLYSSEEAIERAEQRLQWKEKCHHVLYNNSHHFVTWAKTGKENPLTEITKELQYEGNSYPLDPILTMVPTQSLDDIHPGDHLMKLSEHWLVESISESQNTYTVYKCSGAEVSKVKQKWKADDKIFRIDYGGGANIYPARRAIENAVEECEQSKLSSDKFVTKMKTGQKYSVDEQCPLEEETQPASVSQAQFTKSHVHSLEEIHPGDHIMITSWIWQAKHYLIVNTNPKGGKYLAYTTDGNGKVERIENKWKRSSNIFRISYPNYTHSTLAAPVEAIDNADTEYHKWKSSEAFVTMMKTGKCYSLTQQCLFSHDNNIVGYTVITSDTAVDEGDHIILQNASGMCHSVFLYKSIVDTTFLIMPNIKGDGSLYGEVDLAQYQTYRINYKQCLPPDQAQTRACSEVGENLLKENMRNPSPFISWAKTGKQFPVSPGDLVKSMQTQKKPRQIAQLRPWWYEKIISAKDIKVGDHLIQYHTTYWFHCLVTDIISKDRKQFKVIYQFRTSVEEKELSLDPCKEKLYRIKYNESFPAAIAIKNARSKLGEHDFSPTARMKFVRWAKTGSEEGIEVEYLTNEALPVSKSQIWSFGQLTRGDYLVEVVGKLARTHHYLVTEVQSPRTCLAIESWSQSGMVGRVIERTVSFNDSHEFYRINYNHGVCFTAEETVQKAESLIDSSTTDKLWSDINRQKFVHFVKTGQCEDIAVYELNDDRVLLHRSRVESALELKQGDHLERPLHLPGINNNFNHHMIVIETVNKHRCKVIHFGKTGTFTTAVLEEEVDLFDDENCVFRIHYSERINPAKVIPGLRELIRSAKPYSIRKHNCEHFVMKATTGHQISIQVDDTMQRALQYRSVLKPIQSALARATIRGTTKAATKLSVHGVTIVVYATKAAGQAITKAGSKAAFKAGAKASAKAAFKLGYRAAASGTAVGAIGGIAAGINVLIEGPILARGIYKLHRQHKFDVISDPDYKRGVIRQSFTTSNIIVGGVGGAVVGQVAIPVPVLGAAIGGAVGSVIGQGCGIAEGWLASLLVPSKIETLPNVITFNYTEYPSETSEEFQS